jgi:hypothetical protein
MSLKPSFVRAAGLLWEYLIFGRSKSLAHNAFRKLCSMLER